MKKFKDNNKGFSLVELIVVIAIMVVLIAVLGSTILGYVEKSKHSKDIQALDALKTAASTYVADGEGNYADNTVYTLADFLPQPSADDADGDAGDDAAAVLDPNGVFRRTLSEVFTFTDDTADFTGTSKAFRDVDEDDVFIRFNDGAVSIYVESQDDDYDDYEVGAGAALATAAGDDDDE